MNKQSFRKPGDTFEAVIFQTIPYLVKGLRAN